MTEGILVILIVSACLFGVLGTLHNHRKERQLHKDIRTDMASLNRDLDVVEAFLKANRREK